MTYCIGILLAIGLERLMSRNRSHARRTEDGAQRFSPIALLCCIVVVGTLLLQFVIADHAARSLIARVPWVGKLPLAVVFVSVSPNVGYGPPRSDRPAFALLSLVQSGALATFLLNASRRQWTAFDTVTTVATAVASALIAISSKSLISADLYAYVADGLLGVRAAYDPPSTSLPAPFEIIHRLWRLPLVPAAYGPLWLLWNESILRGASDFHTKLIILRSINIVALLAILAACKRLQLPAAHIATVAINPAIWMYYVANGHNDLFAVSLIAVSLLLAEPATAVAAVIAGCAASTKLTLYVAVAAAATHVKNSSKRIAFLIASFVIAMLVGPVLGGKPYLRALSAVAGIYGSRNGEGHGFAGLLHIAAAGCVLVLIVAGLVRRRFFRSAALGFAAFGATFFPWYAIWGLPYAMADRRTLGTLLCALPIITALTEFDMQWMPLGIAIDATLIVLIIRAAAVPAPDVLAR